MRAITLCAVLAPVVAITGYWLYSSWGMGTLTVQVFRAGTNPGQRLADVGVYVESISPKGPGVMHVTDARGVAEFDVQKGAFLNASIQMNRRNKLQFGAVPPFSSPPWELAVDVHTIPPDAWSDAEPEAQPPARIVEKVRETRPPTAPRFPTRWLGNREYVETNAPWGLPSTPANESTPAAEYVVARQAFILGFDPLLRIPRWIANAIRPHDGLYSRGRDSFRIDPLLPSDVQASFKDYQGSGYDRGSLVSGSDIAHHGLEAPKATFYMSALAPQTGASNRFVWRKLEVYSRALAERHGVLHVISGTVLSLQTNRDSFDYVVIGENRVAVPAAFFRVIARVRNQDQPEFLAFLIPNNVSREADFKEFAVSISHIEKLTGLRLFPNLPDGFDTRLKNQVPAKIWSISSR